MRRVCLPLLFIALAAVSVRADEEKPYSGNVLSVRGTGNHEQKPDIARFTATVITKDRTMQAAGEAHMARSTLATSALQAAQADGLVIDKSIFTLTKESDAYPTRNDPNPKPVDKPFTARTVLTVKTAEIGRLNDIVNKLVATGLIEVSGVTFSVTEDRKALNEARRAAVLDAREQARIYAEAADLQLVEIISMTDAEASPPEGYADLPRPAFTVIIPPTVVQFTSSVTMKWRIAGQRG